jgi:redox-sensitive bicupin YhaK (pirin superfamily)
MRDWREVMSDVAAESCAAIGAAAKLFESYAVRETSVGAISVQRALPLRGRRLVGPWCFLDRFGPLTFTEGTPMAVAPHPHMGDIRSTRISAVTNE